MPTGKPATTKYFMHPQYNYSRDLCNNAIRAACGVNFGIFGSYDNALGRALIEKQLGKKFFTLSAALDPGIALYQLDQNLP